MNDFVQDTWSDLREKRLWPVALVLALAILAVPVLLSKSSAQPASEPVVSTATEVDDRVTVKLDGGDAASTSTGSSLDEFAEGDPFTPPGAITKGAGGGVATASLAGPTSDGTTDGGSNPSDGSPQTSDPAPPTSVAPPTTRIETAEYEYVADVTFWNGDRKRRIRSLRKLDMLPNESAPVLIYVGTSSKGGNAVFLVDSTLKAAGEGRCVPSGANCVYVHVGAGSEHAFNTEEGASYRIRIDEIRRVKAGASTARAKAHSSAKPSRRFTLPSLTDLVAVTKTETTPGGRGSSQGADGR